MHHLLEARRHLERAEDAASEARARFFAAVLEAHEAGATLAEIGRELGVSRVRVHQMVTVARGDGGRTPESNRLGPGYEPG